MPALLRRHGSTRPSRALSRRSRSAAAPCWPLASFGTTPRPGLHHGAWRFAVTRPGDLDSVAFMDDGAPSALADDEIRIAVRAIGLNFRDVMVGLGVYPGDARLGVEAAGVVTGVGAAVTG